jgi:hypothetical protein
MIERIKAASRSRRRRSRRHSAPPSRRHQPRVARGCHYCGPQGIPSDSVIAEMILPKSSLPSVNAPGVRDEFTTLFSGLSVPIIAGEQLAIVLSNVGHNGQNIRWAANGPSAYAGGAPYLQPREDTGMTGDQGSVTGPWVPAPFADFDSAFVTWVEPASMPSTPEPTAMLLVGTGAFWLVRRRVGSWRRSVTS